MSDEQQVYRVGDLTDPRDTDPTVDGWDAAMREAERQANGRAWYDDTPIGIWLWEDGGARASVEGIYFDGTVFTP